MAGCGGIGDNGSGFNLFRGTWTGDWQSGADTGTATVQIHLDGSISGQITDSHDGTTYTLSGSVSNPTVSPTTIHLKEKSGDTTLDFTGVITKEDHANAFDGTFTESDGSGVVQTIHVTFESA